MSLFTYVEKNATTTSANVRIIPGVFPVENCECPQGYTGQSCQMCSSGYQRLSQDPTDTCERCNCNNLSSNCDANTGVCFGCTGNSTGAHCDACQAGYYGDPTRGIPCIPCGCARREAADNHTCTLESDGLKTCDSCDLGSTGRRCDLCVGGYYWTSMVRPSWLWGSEPFPHISCLLPAWHLCSL